jgi:hypothetical protein
LEGRKGILSIRYKIGTSLLEEIGKILEIPFEKLSLQNIKSVFESFKETYGSYPIINVDINGEYNISMEQWVREGRALTESGKGVCDCIMQFSYEDAALAGLVEYMRTKYIRFDDLSMEEAIEYLTKNGFLIAKEVLTDIKTTRIGVLEKILQGQKSEYMKERLIQLEYVCQEHKNLLKEMKDSMKVGEMMKKVNYNDEKQFFQSPLFTKQVLIVNLEDFTVSFDSEFVKDYVQQLK